MAAALRQPDLPHRYGARPADPSPRSAAVSAATPTDGDAVDVDRLVNATGLVGLDNRQLSVGSQLAGRRVTLRLEASVVHVLADGFVGPHKQLGLRVIDLRLVGGRCRI